MGIDDEIRNIDKDYENNNSDDPESMRRDMYKPHKDSRYVNDHHQFNCPYLSRQEYIEIGDD